MAAPLETFIFELLAGTKGGSVKWERTMTTDEFQLQGRSGRVRLVRKSLQPLYIEVIIFDSAGRVVGNIGTEPMRSGPWHRWEEALIELFEAASLQASGTTEVLMGLKEEFQLPKVDPPEDDDIPF